jgi:hypothetical protein
MKTVLESRVEGKNYRGKPRLEYVEQIIKMQSARLTVR